jgi:7-cyano-7-deazaguanine synthase
MKKQLVLSSGGLDSTSVLFNVVKKFGAENVVALNLFYGQRHAIEIEAFDKITSSLGVEAIKMDISKIFDFNKNVSSLLEGSNKQVEQGKSYAQELKEREEAGLNSVVDTYIPNRNSLFINIAASIAIQKNCEAVYLGAHADDAVKEESDKGKDELAAYPDCTKAFFESEAKTIFLATGGLVRVECPLIDKTKAQVVTYGLKGGMTENDFAQTWSCYIGHPTEKYTVNGKEYWKPCCKCATCKDRKAALDANKLFNVF